MPVTRSLKSSLLKSIDHEEAAVAASMRLVRSSKPKRIKLYHVACLLFIFIILIWNLLVRRAIRNSYADSSSSLHQQQVRSNHDSSSSPGVFILGMHRSGTSVLARILAEHYGFIVQDQVDESNASQQHLIEGRFANEQGYYERTDVVWQNEHWLQQLQQSAFHHVKKLQQDLLKQPFDSALLALDANGTHALDFLSRVTRQQQPWLVKDPRLSLTLPLWLNHWQAQEPTNRPPAMILLYRHPIPVAWSLLQRDNCEYDRAFGLWVVYNQLALQHTLGLCRVVVTNHDLRTQPHATLERLFEELINRCHVPRPKRPRQVISIKQQLPIRDRSILPDCSIDYSDRHKPLRIRWTELNLTTLVADKKRVRQAMQLYCDLESGRALQDDYIGGLEWDMLELA